MRILALTLIAACSYHEPIGSSLLTNDASPSGGDAVATSGDAGALDGGADPRVLTDTEECSFTQLGADLYCLDQDHFPTATDDSRFVRVRRVTDTMQFVDEATMTSPPIYDMSAGTQVQDADRIYFGAQIRPQTQFEAWDWAIYSYDKHAHTFALLADGLDEQPRNLFVAEGTLFFTEYEHVPPNTTYHYDRLFSMPVGGGAPALLTDQLASIEDLTTDGTWLYAIDFGRYNINAISIAAPHRVLLVANTGAPYDTAVPPPQALLVAGNWLYYSTQGQPMGTIQRVPLPSANATQDEVSPVNELVASGMNRAVGMVAKDSMLYYTEWFSGLSRAPLDGSAPPETLVTFGQQGNFGPILVGDWVYFSARHSDGSGGVIAQYHITP